MTDQICSALGTLVHSNVGKQKGSPLQGACFVEGTPVLTEDSTPGREGDFTFFNIEHLSVGCKVLSRNEITGEMAYKRVTKFFDHGFRKICSLHCTGRTIIDTYHSDIAIGVTADHPFWVQGKGWTVVRDLRPGDELWVVEEGQVTVKEVTLDEYTSPVYNLEVEDFHTYFVGSGIWVHNKDNTKIIDVEPLNAVIDNPKRK
jgi:hypothetical protein